MHTGIKINRDGLVLHYDVANIKSYRGEETVNLNPYPTLSHWINSGACIINIDDVYILPPFFYNQLHIWSCEVTTTGSIHFGMQPTSVLPSTTYTISVWYRQNRAGTSSPYIRSKANNNSIGFFTYNGNPDSSFWPTGIWIRISATATTDSNETGIYLSNYVGTQISDKIWYYGYQIEQKDHVTQYTPDSRGTTVASGGGIVDLSGYNNNGEAINGLLYNKKNCGSLLFDGVDDYINLGNVLNISINDYTINCWVYIKSDSTNFTTIFAKKGLAAATAGYAIYYNGSIKRLMWSNGDGNTSQEYYTNNTIPLDSWINVVCVRCNGEINKGYFYINGILYPISNNPTCLNVSNNYDLTIGKNSTGALYFDSSLSIFQIYNRALSSSEILQNYNATYTRYLSPIVTDGLLLNLDASDISSYPRSGTTWRDLSGNYNNGTLQNGVLYKSDKEGSLYFDATDDAIIVTNSNLSTITNGTISFWGKLDNVRDWLFMTGDTTSMYILATSNGISDFYHSNIGNNIRSIYVDGVVVNAPPSDLKWHNITLTGVDLSGWTIFKIAHYSGTGYKYNGLISQILFYNRPLTQNEVISNYNATKKQYI